MQLTQKETDLLKELKDQEKLCVDKYAKHSSCAKDPQLKGLFSHLSAMEQQHYDTITQIENGNVPAPQQNNSSQQTFNAKYTVSPNPDKDNDCYLCTDLLTGEKHASHLYDTCIFEFRDEKTRDLLNSIQKSEQAHGKLIYDYMSANSMY